MFLLSLLVPLTVCQSRAFIFTQVVDEQELQCKVKQIDEFFSRFNLETDYMGDPVVARPDSEAVDSVMKIRNLASLLNIDTFINSDNKPDSIATEFLEYVARNNKRIHYADTAWCGEAFASLTYEGKSYPVRIFLRTENVRDVIYKWVISDVRTPVMSLLTDSMARQISIMPGAHGSSFITLPETINLNARDVKSFFPKNYTPDRLSVFAFLVSSGKIQIKNVTKVVYHFRLDDYEFIVERFEKGNSYNNGWLISRITRNTNDR